MDTFLFHPGKQKQIDLAADSSGQYLDQEINF